MGTKLDPRAKKVIFLCFRPGINGYRLWCPKSKKLDLSRDVIFDEYVMLKLTKGSLESSRGEYEDGYFAAGGV